MDNNQAVCDALYKQAIRLIRLANECKIFTTKEGEREVGLLLSDTASAILLAGGTVTQFPFPLLIPDKEDEQLVAKPYDRRKEM